MRTKLRFWNDQVTPSFPEGAPQREEYHTNGFFRAACERYADEWNKLYECTGCDPGTTLAADCPDCGS